MIIAECGINHNGSIPLAKRMIEEAKVAGADLVKFQLYNTDKLCKPDNPNYQWLKNSELSFTQAWELFDYGRGNDTEVFFSVFDIERVEWGERIGVKRYKIASQSCKDFELRDAICKTGKEVVYSDPFGKGLEHWGTGKPHHLYCIPMYPAPPQYFFLEKVRMGIRDAYQGISDHSLGLDVAKIAIVKGAVLIEKHFTLDKSLPGPDQIISMEPNDLAELVRWQKIVNEVL